MMSPAEVALLRRLWFPVARTQDVLAGPHRGRLLDEELVIYRSSTGIVVAQGMCPHRGASMASGSVVDGEIECPYHGWRFDAVDGRLTAVPSLPPEAPPPRCGLRIFRSRVAYGLVWAALDEPYLPLVALDRIGTDWELVDGPLTHFRVDGWHIAYGEPVWLNCGMRALHENFSDMSHFAFVHRETMGDNVGPRIPEYTLYPGAWSFSYEVRNLPAEAPAVGAAPDVSTITLQRTNEYTVYLPSFTTIYSRSGLGGTRFVAQFVSPTSTDGEHVRNFWCAGLDEEMRTRFGVALADTFAFDERVTNEDYPILEASRPREQPLSARGQVHTRADSASIAYRRATRRLLAQFASEQGIDDPSLAIDSDDGDGGAR